MGTATGAAPPERIVIKYGAMFTPKVLDRWACKSKVTLHPITSG
jgi:hypothetical protein